MIEGNNSNREPAHLADELLALRTALNTGAGLDDPATVHGHQVMLDKLEALALQHTEPAPDVVELITRAIINCPGALALNCPGSLGLTYEQWARRAAENAAKALASRPSPDVAALVEAWEDVISERKRQIEVEGWTPEHDDSHYKMELAFLAAAYALHDPEIPATAILAFGSMPRDMRDWFKPKSRRENLVRAGALILAEIERLDREAAATLRKLGGQP